MVRLRSLRTRIAVAFALLLLAVQAAGFVFINAVLSQSMHREIAQKLIVGQRIFGHLHEENSRQLAQAASILSSDFAFREAAATGDRSTVISALANQGGRVNADITMLAGMDNVVIADTLHPENAGKPFPFVHLLAIAQKKGDASGIVLIGGSAYDLVLVPVLAPMPIAWVAMGFIIDDKFAARMQTLTSLEVSFWNPTSRGGEWNLLATTMPPAKRSSLIAAISRIDRASAGNAVLRVGDEDYVTAIPPANPSDENAIVTVLQNSLREELAPLHEVQATLFGFGLISLLATVVASALIARGMTRPIRALSVVAQKMERGDYSQSIEIEQQDEIGQLASALNHMRRGIAAREAKIGDMAYHDALTGLPNRALFRDRLEQAIRSAKRGESNPTILIMDLDRFKEVNDSLGHHVGDLLLKEIASRCTGALSRACDTVARLGGDEFAILLLASDTHGAEVIARRVLSALEAPTTLEGQSVIIGGSIGIASYPEHGEDMHTLLRHGDMAMYAAKRSNTGFAVYDPRYNRQSQQRLSLMSELRHAVEHDDLVLYYQPKVDLVTGTIKHVEALVRWIHPERGFIAPDDFIPFAEHSGYIKAITGWVIAEALRQLADWHGRGIDLNVSINISARDLTNPELPAMFTGLDATRAGALQWLSLEITESGIMTDAARALGTLEFLRGLGLRLSIDDFGTGYSSLSYLKRLPVQELKIDKSFVIDMAEDKDGAMIVLSTINLGHNMGLEVVAEGVENQETWDLLKTWGCDMAQGYFIARPMPGDQLVQWLAASNSDDREAKAA